ncbi:MAG: family 20 glycosylhydrolase [Saprospiraceae bacterium]|nr:family 20 glycosylhydrolase [Saprospiraceae bacterium]
MSDTISVILMREFEISKSVQASMNKSGLRRIAPAYLTIQHVINMRITLFNDSYNIPTILTLMIFLVCFAPYSYLLAQQVTPQPQSIEYGGDSLSFGKEYALVVKGIDQLDPSPIIKTIQSELHTLQKRLFTSTGKVEKTISLTLHKKENNSTSNKLTEGYELNIDRNEIDLYAQDHAGFLYAMQSLQQLFYINQESGLIPCQRIVDSPDFPFRGIMDDISRGPLPTLTFMKKQIRRLAHLKINVFSFYIEHVLRTKSHPDFSPLEGLTIDELKELSDYAEGYNIQLMGSFQSLGHFRNILSHPNYMHLGVGDRMLNPGDSASLLFLKEVYNEIIPAVKHPFFNINCDEAYDLSRGHKLKQLADSLGEGIVYAQHIIPLLNHVQERDKRPAIWGDMILKHPEIFELIPPKTVILPWDYSDRKSFDDLLDPIAEHGFEFIGCPGIVNSYRLWPDLLEAKNNIRNFASATFDKGGMGIMTTVWDDGGRHFFATDWYGIVLAGAYGWNPDGTDDRMVDQHFSRYFLHGEPEAFSAFLHTLAKLQNIDRLSNLSTHLVEMNYEPQSEDTVLIDTTSLQAISTILVEAKQQLDRFDQQNSHPYHWSSDLAVWHFKLDETIEACHIPFKLMQLSKTIANVYRESNEVIRRNDILRARATAKKNLRDAKHMKDLFIKLWRTENRNHWFDEAEKIYECRTKTWKEQYDFLLRLSHHGTTLVPRDKYPIYSPSPGLFITYWLGAGPFNTVGNLDFDFFAKEQGERNLRPAAIDYFLNPSGTYQGWNKIISPYPDRINFSDYYNSPNPDVAYASCRIEVNAHISVKYELRSTGIYTLFLGSERIIPHKQSIEKSSGTIHLSKGHNYLIFKSLEPLYGPWNFSFRVLHSEITQNKYKYILK